ncbi:Protein MLP1-like protein [Diplonema papillatum]|nr:Protein MLP1-like protein [Diplonema papillatum]
MDPAKVAAVAPPAEPVTHVAVTCNVRGMKEIRPQSPRTRATRFFEDATKEAARINKAKGIKRAHRFLAKKCAGRVADLEAELHRRVDEEASLAHAYDNAQRQIRKKVKKQHRMTREQLQGQCCPLPQLQDLQSRSETGEVSDRLLHRMKKLVLDEPWCQANVEQARLERQIQEQERATRVTKIKQQAGYLDEQHVETLEKQKQVAAQKARDRQAVIEEHRQWEVDEVQRAAELRRRHRELYETCQTSLVEKRIEQQRARELERAADCRQHEQRRLEEAAERERARNRRQALKEVWQAQLASPSHGGPTPAPPIGMGATLANSSFESCASPPSDRRPGIEEYRRELEKRLASRDSVDRRNYVHYAQIQAEKEAGVKVLEDRMRGDADAAESLHRKRRHAAMERNMEQRRGLQRQLYEREEKLQQERDHTARAEQRVAEHCARLQRQEEERQKQRRLRQIEYVTALDVLVKNKRENIYELPIKIK